MQAASAVILLDTNQLLGKSPDAPVLRMLKKVAEEAGHDLVLPEMVAEEYLAHYRHDVEDAAEKARGGIDELRRLVPRWPGDTYYSCCFSICGRAEAKRDIWLPCWRLHLVTSSRLSRVRW